MNTKLLALFFLLQQKLKTKEAVQEELSHYTTEYLFKIMEEGDKNPSFKPELIFEVIEQRGDYTGEQLINFLNCVKFVPYNGLFKTSVCTKLLKRDDYTVHQMRWLFNINDGTEGQTIRNVLSLSFQENKPILLLKLASCSLSRLLDISENVGYFASVTAIAKKLAEEKLSELSTTDLLMLENKGGRVRVDKELVNRADELKKIVSM